MRLCLSIHTWKVLGFCIQFISWSFWLEGKPRIQEDGKDEVEVQAMYHDWEIFWIWYKTRSSVGLWTVSTTMDEVRILCWFKPDWINSNTPNDGWKRDCEQWWNYPVGRKIPLRPRRILPAPFLTLWRLERKRARTRILFISINCRLFSGRISWVFPVRYS